MDAKRDAERMSKRKTIVFVTDQFQCERIITAGRKIADITHTELSVYNITCSVREQNPEALQYLYDIAKKNGSELTVVYSDEIVQQMTQAIKSQQTVNVVTGQPSDESSVLLKIWNRFVYINFFTVNAEGRLNEVDTISKVAK